MSQADTATNQYVGKVKWFNNKSGYGFVTFIDSSDFKGKDIFAHHSSLNVKDEIYKYLVQGEYVEFNANNNATVNNTFFITLII